MYAHPNKALGALDKNGVNNERAQILAWFLSSLERERKEGRVQFCTMADVESRVRGQQPT